MNVTNEELQSALVQRMSAEQEQYCHRLLEQSPNEILSHALEYAIRESIVEMVTEGDLPVGQAGALLKSRTPLADVFKQWRNHQVGYLEGIRDALERSADLAVRRQREER